jgi:hypothetical protein
MSNEGPTMPPPGGDPHPTQPMAPPHAPPPADAPTTSDTPKPWWKRWWGIALIVLGVFVVLSALTGDDEETDAPEDTAAVDEPADEDAASDEPVEDAADPDEPADTQEQIEEEVAEDEPAEVEPEPEPEPEPFDPVVISGSGDDIVDVDTYPMPMVVKFTHEGSANFAVHAYDDAGDRDLLVNEIGAYTGTRPLNFMGDPTEFEITASGPWTATITPLLEQPSLSDTTSGSGDQVLFIDTGAGRLTLTHDGSSNFAVFAYSNTRDLLVNEIGAYEGTVRLPDAVALEIVADGNWTTQTG